MTVRPWIGHQNASYCSFWHFFFFFRCYVRTLKKKKKCSLSKQNLGMALFSQVSRVFFWLHSIPNFCILTELQNQTWIPSGCHETLCGVCCSDGSYTTERRHIRLSSLQTDLLAHLHHRRVICIPCCHQPWLSWSGCGVVCVCVFLHACTSTSIHIPLFRRPGLVNFGGWVRGNINICPEWSDYKRTALSTSVHMWNFASLHAYQMTTWWSDLTSTLFMLLITSQYFLHKERHILFSICWINRENKLINILL